MKQLLTNSALYALFNKHYQSLPSKDQYSLKILGAFLLIIFVVYGLITPSHDFSDKSQQNYLASLDTLEWMKANKGAVSKVSNEANSTNTGQSLLTIATSSSQRFSIHFKRYEPVGDSGLNLWLENTGFNNVISWLNELEKKHGVRVKEISADSQKEIGLVNVRLVLQG